MYRSELYAKQLAHTAENDLPKIAVFDAETTMEGPDKDPAPFGPRGANVLLWAYATDASGAKSTTDVLELMKHFGGETDRIWVAHNIKFDWQHVVNSLRKLALCARSRRRNWMLLFWDTAIAEYILSAQISKFVSLDELATRYGAGKKGDVLKTYLDMGLRSQDVPFEELENYAKQDVMLTHDIMYRQWGKATPRQRSLIMIHSAMAVIFAEAEFEGMHVDMREAIIRRDTEFARATNVRTMFKEVMGKFVLGNTYHSKHKLDVAKLAHTDQFNTPRALSMVMFGHPKMLKVECTLPVPVGRTRKAHVIATLEPEWAVLNPAAYGAPMHSDRQSYLLNEAVLNKIIAEGSPAHSELARAVLAARAAEKKAETYYQGLISAQSKYGDNTIHHTLNVTATATGRTSSSNPNSQNQPEEVKEVFEPREDHVYCEFDFRQLEVWALAQLSKDRQLMNDLRAGVDIHYETGKAGGMWRATTEMTKDSRRRVKSVVFGLIYGGGPKTLAEQSGLSVGVVSKLISAFYTRYRGVRQFHDDVVADVSKARVAGGAEALHFCRDEVVATSNGSKRLRVMQLKLPAASTGRMYAFPESDNEFGGSPFSPTNIKNYPVQGFATGDIVPLALVLLDMDMPKDAYVITAVHDSGLNSVLNKEEVRDQVDAALRRLPSVLEVSAQLIWDLDWGGLCPGISVEWKERWSTTPIRAYNVG